MCVQFPFFLFFPFLSLVCVGVAGVRRNWIIACVCMWVSLCLGGVLLLAALSSLAAPPPSPLTLTTEGGGGEEEGVRGKKGRGRENEWITEWIALCVRPCSLVVGLGYTDVLCSDCSLCRPTWIYIFTQGVFVTHPFGFFCIVRVFVFCLFFSLACLQSAWRHSWTFCRKCESHC